MFFYHLLKRELFIAFKNRQEIAWLLGFFVIAVLLFPFAVGTAPGLLKQLACGIIWVCALLASLLSLDRLFFQDQEDGSLEQLLLSGVLPEWIVATKILAHWLATGVVIAAVSPLLGILLSLEPTALKPLVLSLLLGTPSLTLIGAIGAALTLGLRRGQGLLPILVLPLTIPILIFGVSASQAFTMQHGLLLLGILMVLLPLAIMACSVAVRYQE